MDAHLSRRFPLLLAMTAVLLFAFALRMWHLNTESVWHDEGWSIRAIQGPFTTPDDNTPYLYYLSGHLLWRVSGAEGGAPPLLFRVVSVLPGLLTVAAALWLGRRWYGAGVSLSAGVLVAASPLLWEYSQEVRAYVVVPLVAVLLLDAAGRVLRRGRGEPVPRRVWAYAFVVMLAGLYTHNLSVPLVVWMNAALGLVWLGRRDWRRMFTWAALMLALIAAYIPWLLTQAPSGTPLNTVPQPGLSLVRDIWYAYWLPVLPQLRDMGAVWWLDALGVLALVAGAALVMRRARGAWLLVSQALLVPALSFALIYAATIDFHPRYFVAAVPGTLLLFAAGMMALAAALAGVTRVRRAGTVALLALVLAGGLAAAQSIGQIRAERAYQHDDFDGLARYYASLPDGFTIVLPFETEPALQFYYTQVYDIGANFVNVPLYADEATALAALRAIAGPVEFLTWYQLPADVRGMYPCILTAASQFDVPGELVEFYGLATQRFVAQVGGFRPVDIAPGYREIMPVRAGVMDSPHGVCVRTAWTLPAPVDADYGVAASLVNPAGWTVTAADAAVARADNAPTSRWSPGDTGTAYALLTLPPGAPLAQYDLALTVYSGAQPSGLDVIDADGNPAGKRYTVADAVTARGEAMAADADTPSLLVDNTGDTRTVETGQPLDVTVVLPGDGDLQRVEIVLALGDWSQVVRTFVLHDRLAWARFVVPAGTLPPGRSGEATLRVDGEAVARYTVNDVPRMFEPPAYAVPVGADFPGVATLAGADLPDNVTAGEAFDVALVWQADAQSADIPYTVFVQLISADGVNLAQSDAQPAAGARPTTGWMAGEYVVDLHTLRWNVEAYTGAATLIAGFYDADGGFRRILTADGADSARVGAVRVGE